MSSTAPKPLPTGRITLLFTDIEGSTALVQGLGAEGYGAVRARHNAILRAAIAAFGGREMATHGDAFFAVFERAADGLGAALTAQRELAAEPWPEGGTVRVRMGLHTGEPRLTEEGYVGVDLNRAARICDAANGGQVFVSGVTRALLGLDGGARAGDGALATGASHEFPFPLTLRDLGEHRLKDLRYAERLYQVLAEGLADLVAAPRTAGEVAARDRIVVRDPGLAEADPTRVDAVPTALGLSVAETLAAMEGALVGGGGTVVLTPEQVRAAAEHRAEDWRAWRLGRVAEWSQPRYRLDGRFVDLSLLVDQGEDAAGGRWAAREERYEDLATLLEAVPDPALVLLGPPGSGKSTLLRRLELDLAIAGLRAGTGASPGSSPTTPHTFFIPLNQHKAERPGEAPPAPGDWLAARWAARNPGLGALDDVLAEGRMILLLDGLNELPAGSERAFRERVEPWRNWLVRLVRERPGNRVLFSCRTLDYAAPLSTPALRVPQVVIEAMSEERVRRFLELYSPARAEGLWEKLEATGQLAVFRLPYFLKLLVDQVEAAGGFPEGRAGLFTGLVRQSLRREIERGNPLFEPDTLLTERDYRRMVQGSGWRTAYELPERGVLVPKLSALAYGMQAEVSGGAQVRVGYDAALGLIDHERDADIVKAGLALAVLEEDAGRDELLYYHQLVQEYFAARELARTAELERARRPWRAAEIRPGVRELIETLPAGETLPALPQTGWEETAVLAAAMAEDAEGYVERLMEVNLVLAGRSANQAEVRARLSAGFVEQLRWALVHRSRDAEADLRERIAAGLELGWLGDPRFERRVGPEGAEYLMPPLVEIPGGVYPIGADEPFEWTLHGASGTETAHMPRHKVEILPFSIGQFPVTNAEWACFIAAGGYEDERWWETEDAQKWRLGIGTSFGMREGARADMHLIKDDPGMLEQWLRNGQIDMDKFDRWQVRLAMNEAEFEQHLINLYPDIRYHKPRFWDENFHVSNTLPVIGVTWYEALAYCSWLSYQTGSKIKLPSETQWEAATRGADGKIYASGDVSSPLNGNVLETRLRRLTPIGVFVNGDSDREISDLTGDIYEWTSSLWGINNEEPDYSYPYDSKDGREDQEASNACQRIVRGGSYNDFLMRSRAYIRYSSLPGGRAHNIGLRMCKLQTRIESICKNKD